MNFCRLVNRIMLRLKIFNRPAKEMNFIAGVFLLLISPILVLAMMLQYIVVKAVKFLVLKPLKYVWKKISLSDIPEIYMDFDLLFKAMLIFSILIFVDALLWTLVWPVSIILSYFILILVISTGYELTYEYDKSNNFFKKYLEHPVVWLYEKTTSKCDLVNKRN